MVSIPVGCKAPDVCARMCISSGVEGGELNRSHGVRVGDRRAAVRTSGWRQGPGL